MRWQLVGRCVFAAVVLSVAAWLVSPGSALAQSDGDLRLVGIASGEDRPRLGRLLIYHDGEWGTVCISGSDSVDDFGAEEAKVACRQLHYDTSIGFSNWLAAGSTSPTPQNPILLRDLDCYPFQGRLTYCRSSDWGETGDCTHSQDVVLQCQHPMIDRDPVGQPVVTGTVEVGQTLTVDASGVSDPNGPLNLSFSYKWIGDSVDDVLQEGRGTTYVLQTADVGKLIRVVASFTDLGGNTESVTSLPTARLTYTAPGNQSPMGAPTIDGTVRQGVTLTIDTSGITDADGLSDPRYRYEWLFDGTVLGSATNRSYRLKFQDVGKSLTVRVHFIDDGSSLETLASAGTVVAPLEAGTDGAVRLQGGTSSQGRLEVHRNGRWGTVCRHEFDVQEAAVFCRLLGFQDGNVWPASDAPDGDSDTPIWLGPLDCAGHETSWTRCHRAFPLLAYP